MNLPSQISIPLGDRFRLTTLLELFQIYLDGTYRAGQDFSVDPEDGLVERGLIFH
jgi:hypothetical protein